MSADRDVPPPEDFGTPDYVAGTEPERTADGPSPRPSRRARVVTVADIECREVAWLWPGRLPAGMIAVLDGPPGIGKSSVVCDLVARMTTGRPWPGTADACEPRHVVLLGHEDSPEHTIRPRLEAAGADLARVGLLDEVAGHLPRLPDDVRAIEEVIRDRNAGLLVIDPVSAYMGGADMHRDNEVRATLAPLAGLAQRTGATVLLLRHLRKSGGTDAIYRGIGSVAFSGIARATLMLLRDPDDHEARVLAWPKLSVGPSPKSLRLRVSPSSAGNAPRIEWDAAPCDLSADDVLLREDQRHRGSGAREHAATSLGAAEEWLAELLREHDGAVSTNEAKARCAEAGIAWRSVERARSRLGVKSRLAGPHGAQQWFLSVSNRAARDETAKEPPSAVSTGDEVEATANPREPHDSDETANTANRRTQEVPLAASSPEGAAGAVGGERR